ncbi:MAG: alpha/beta fold hydrolase [Cyclobacteriaceae bacterium]
MTKGQDITYSQYGEGEKLLFAFHGYGMDGTQFNVLRESFARRYKLIGFHMPYHKNGPLQHQNWLQGVSETMYRILDGHDMQEFDMAGYSIGSKIVLYLVEKFRTKINKIYLFAPYGLEDHWGLQFVTRPIGNTFFRKIINTGLPISIMKLVTGLRIIDETHFQIIRKELLSRQQKLSLCHTLKMAGDIKIEKEYVVTLLNRYAIDTCLIYGKHDVLFSYDKRNRKLLQKIEHCQVVQVDEGHWLVTDRLDTILSTNLQQV